MTDGFDWVGDMMERRPRMLMAMGFLFFLPSAYELHSQEKELIPFELKDQFDRVYRGRDYGGHIVVLVGSDKDGSQYNGKWSRAIHESLRGEPNLDHVRFLGMADLRGVPFFLKGYVKGKFPRDKDQWVLMDWKGRLIHRAHGYEVDDGKLRVIVDKIKSLAVN